MTLAAIQPTWQLLGWQYTNTGVVVVDGRTESHRAPWSRPAVDDLLAWLQRSGLKLEGAWWCDVGDYTVDLHREGIWALRSEGPTLLAALEAAVRQVAEDTP